MSVDRFSELANEAARDIDPMFLVNSKPVLSLFFGDLISLHHDNPKHFVFTVRHIAACLPHDESEKIEIREARVCESIKLLCSIGAVQACIGPDSRVLDGADWLPTYTFAPGMLWRR